MRRWRAQQRPWPLYPLHNTALQTSASGDVAFSAYIRNSDRRTLNTTILVNKTARLSVQLSLRLLPCRHAVMPIVQMKAITWLKITAIAKRHQAVTSGKVQTHTNPFYKTSASSLCIGTITVDRALLVWQMSLASIDA